MRDHLRALLIVLVTIPPVLAGVGEENRQDAPPFQNKLILFGAQRAPRESGVVEIIPMNPDGTKMESLLKLEKVGRLTGRISPDGRRLAFGIVYGGTQPWETWIWEAGMRRKLTAEGAVVAWSPDGSSLLCIRPKDKSRWESFIFEIASSESRVLPIPQTDVVEDWSPDGKLLSVMAGNVENVFEHRGKGTYPLRQLDLLSIEGSGRKRITSEPLLDNIWSRFSPDGSTVAHYQRRHEGNRETDKVYEYLVAHKRSEGRTVEILRPDKLDESLHEVPSFPSYPFYWCPDGTPCWSPDGSQIAVCLDNGKWRSFHQEPIEKWRSGVVIVSPAGKILNRIDVEKLGIVFVCEIDWK